MGDGLRRGLVLGCLALATSGVPSLGPAAAMAQPACGSLEQIADQIFWPVVAAPWGPMGAVVGGALGLATSENTGEMFLRCWDAATADDAGARRPGPRRVAGASGDPHLTTLDGLAFDFHGAGDFVLAEHAPMGVEVQARFVRANDGRFSATQGLAIRVGDRIVTLHDGPPADREPVVIDARPVAFLDGGWYEDRDLRIQRFRQWFLVRFSNGLVVATVSGRTNWVHVPAAWSGETRGLLGDRDGDPANDVARRDGTVIDPLDVDALYSSYLTDWIVGQDGSLFSTPFDVDTLGPTRPESVPTLATLPADAVAAARELCLGVGLRPDRGLEACMFDVALTGDEAWATSDAALPGPVVAASAVAPRVTRTVPLGAGTVTGTLESPGVAHEVSVPAATGDATRVLQAIAPCDAAVPSAVVVVENGRLRTQRSLVCGASLALPPSAHTLRLVHPGGGTADYRFQVTERAPDGRFEAGALSLDTAVTIPSAPVDQRWRWRLEGVAGTALFLTEAELEPGPDVTGSVCGARWALLAPDDAVLGDGSLCIGVPRLDASDGTVFEARVPAGVEATFVVGRIPSGTRVAGDLDDRVRYDGELQSPGQVDTYRLEIDAGGELVLWDPVGSNPCGVVWSVAMGGEELFRGPSCFDTEPISITTAGAVVIAVDAGANPGPYSLEIVRVPPSRVEALRLGEVQDATIETPGARARFSFTGTAGDQLVLASPAGANADCRIVWRIVGPDVDGNVDDVAFEGPVCFDTDPITLTATGAHVVEVDGTRASTGAVALSAFAVPEPRTEDLRFGEEQDASIETPGARVRFGFTGSAGDQLVLASPAGANRDCRIVWRIVGPDPDGNVDEVVFEGPVCFDTDPITLTTTGAHVVEVDGTRAATGGVTLVAEAR